jgi:diacylglycerol kinase (ATP)
MRHLFIINPHAAEVKADALVKSIEDFFSNYPATAYNIHVTRWKRDAVGWTRRYVSNQSDTVRVYVMGGDSTLFEVLNGVAMLPNAELAYLPYGKDNALLHSLGGNEKLKLMRSIPAQFFAETVKADIFRMGTQYALSHCMGGAEALSLRDGDQLHKLLRLPRNWCYQAAALKILLTGETLLAYHIIADGEDLSGEYITFLVTNVSSYASGLKPAPEARWDDGYIDLYLVRPCPKWKVVDIIANYVSGKWDKFPDYILHRQCKKIAISSTNPITLAIDEQLFYDTDIIFEALPGTLKFVLPTAAPAAVHSAPGTAPLSAEDIG